MHHSHVAFVSVPSAQIQKCRSMQIQLLECLLPVVGETVCGKPDEHAIQRPLPSRVGRRKRYFSRIPFAMQRLTADRWLMVLPILVVCTAELLGGRVEGSARSASRAVVRRLGQILLIWIVVVVGVVGLRVERRDANAWTERFTEGDVCRRCQWLALWGKLIAQIICLLLLLMVRIVDIRIICRVWCRAVRWWEVIRPVPICGWRASRRRTWQRVAPMSTARRGTRRRRR